MTDNEFIGQAASLRALAMNRARGYALADEDVEDIAQDALLKMWAMRADILSVPQAVRLATVITEHLAVDHFRNQNTMPLSRNHESTLQAQMPDARMEDNENEVWLLRQLRQLPTKEYQVLHMRHVERKTTADIAAILGISPRSVSTLLSRARRKLGEALKQRNK